VGVAWQKGPCRTPLLAQGVQVLRPLRLRLSLLLLLLPSPLLLRLGRAGAA
jgi:hypothetical protein